jgi:hypothetical protein
MPIDLGDDDICGAFRHGKYHPDLVPMHCATIGTILTAATGTTFGDNTSPPNFEPVARARSELARHLWGKDGTIAAVAPHLPEPKFEAEPTAAEIDAYQKADADSQNTGANNPDGTPRPPPYNTHVDDCFYATIRKYTWMTACASVYAPFWILGFPSKHTTIVLSLDKFHTTYGPARRVVGQHVHTRTLLVTVPGDKRQEVVALLVIWLAKVTFTLRECAELHGLLESISRYNRWGRAQFCTLQNAMRRILTQRYRILKRQQTQASRDQRSRFIRKQLPSHLEYRLLNIIRREEAQLLWNTTAVHTISKHLRSELQFLHDYLADESQPPVPW